jgi:hypothetical protein
MLVATADIPEDTVLFTIPRDAIINTLTSDLPKRVPQIFEDSTAGLEDTDNEADEDGDDTGPPDSWVSLILVMIYEYLQGEKSKWKPYFDVLPEEFETLMFWSDKELEELQASAIASKIGKDEAENMFRVKVLPAIQEHANVFYPQGAQRLNGDQLIALAHRMGSTIMAYAFDLENDDDEQEPEDEDEWMEDKEGQLMMGMVPMADILNADAEFNVRRTPCVLCRKSHLTWYSLGTRESRRRKLDGDLFAAYSSWRRNLQLLRSAVQRGPTQTVRLCDREAHAARRCRITLGHGSLRIERAIETGRKGLGQGGKP